MSNTNRLNIFSVWIIKIILPVCILAAGAAGYLYFKSSGEKIKRRPPVRQAVAVETLSMTPGSFPRRVRAMGTVIPDRQVEIKSKVSAEVVYASESFVRGGVVEKGQVLIRLDDADYKIEVKKAQSALEKALSDFDIEKGSQKIAQEEYKLISKASKGDVQPTDLAMRKPQLVQAQASVESARADLEKAKLNLDRTTIVAPFNGLVLEKNVALGSLVTAQGTVATLVDIDTYNIEVLVPPDRLGVVHTGEISGSRVIVKSQFADQQWEGRVVRTTGQIADKSRMAGVLVAVSDPLGLKSAGKNPPLMLGDHVAVTIMGQKIDNVYALSRSYLRDGDVIWLFNGGRLDIRKVNLAWKEDGVVYIDKGIEPDDQVITTDLPAPVPGMAVQKISGDRS